MSRCAPIFNPRRPCPDCGRTVTVSPTTEQVRPHSDAAGNPCVGSRALIPLYDDTDTPQPA